MSDFDRLVPGLCDAHRARIATIPLPDDRRHPDAEVPFPTYPLTRPDAAERAGRTSGLSSDARVPVRLRGKIAFGR